MPFGFPTVVFEDAMQDLARHSIAEAAPHFDRAVGVTSASTPSRE
jgi:hypothetical protein